MDSNSTRLSKRVYFLRIMGLALGFLCAASVFYQKQMHLIVWLIIIINGFLWPHIAYYLAKESSNPHKAELRNFILDSFFGGFWIPFLDFNLFPSMTLAVMLGMNMISTGGFPFLLKGIVALLGGISIGILVYGFNFHPESNLIHIIFSLPLLTIYPLSIGMVIYKLSVVLNNTNNTLRVLNRTDGLTGINNRRYWEEKVDEEFKRCKRSGMISTLIMIDIDLFKKVNDSYGHLIGDAVLRKIARILQDNLRKTDILGRYGGEEFGVILPDTDQKGAMVIAEKLRGDIEKTILLDSYNVRCTISLGVALFCIKLDEYSAWIDNSDKALYGAKKSGRNRIMIYSS